MSEEENFNEDKMAEFRTEKFDYRQALMMQVNRINNLSVKIREDKASAQTYYFAVVQLEAMLNPYLDKEYIKLRNLLKTHVFENEEKNPPPKELKDQLDLFPFWVFNMVSMDMAWVSYGVVASALLQSLMARKNLLLESEEELKTDAKDQSST